MINTDTTRFLKAWLRNPRAIGAVTPSGPALARLMTQDIHPERGPVLELGPGTGVFTQALLKRGIPRSQLALVESNPQMAGRLALRFPGVRVYQRDAAKLHALPSPFGRARASAVVSGLPMLSMPLAQVKAILAAVFQHHLDADGVFYQFTYGPRCPFPRATLHAHGLEAIRIGRVLLNLPPATVYRIQRSGLQAV
ncbi:class I SAM-dependent methyltransferase [Frateuria aurantia]